MNILKRELVLSIEVDSSIDVVWEVLTNFQNYPNWNPFITSISGELLPKKVLNITMNFGKKNIQKYNVKLLTISKNREFSWVGYFIFPGLINGYHSFRLYTTGFKTVVERRELFYGILVPFVWRSFINKKIKKGFIDSNDALKKYVESVKK